MSYARQLGYEIMQAIKQNRISKNELMSELKITEIDFDKLCAGRIILTFKEQDQVEKLLNTSYERIMSKQNSTSYQSVVHCITPFSNLKNLDIIMDFIDAYIDMKEINLSEKKGNASI